MLFQRLGVLENIVIKLENPEDPNNFFNFQITSFEEEDDFVVFGIQIFGGLFLGNLLNEKIYSLYFDIKAQNHDNKMKRKYIVLHSNSISLLEIVNLINSSTTILFGDDEVPPMLIVFHLSLNGVFTYKYLLADLGRGNYGLGGIPLTIDDIEQVFAGLVDLDDVINDPETDFFDLGDITGTNVSNVVNIQNPPLTFQPFNEGLVVIRVVNNGINEAYLFLGDGGIYGFGASQTTMADFELFNSGNNILTRTSQLINDGDSGSSPFVTEESLQPYLDNKADIDDVVLLSQVGVPNGVPSLNGNGKIPLSQIDDALLGNVKWKGLYNGNIISSSPDASLNGSILPAPGVGNVGWYFIANAEFINSGLDYKTGDWIISNGIIWNKVDNTDAVSSVAGLTGNVSVENLRAVLINVTEVSIQNETGTEQFKMTDYLRIKGVNFNSGSKQIEINPLFGGVIFVSNGGNDTTAQKENRAKPYLTLDAAMSAYWLDPTIDYIEIISDTTFTLSGQMNNGTSTRKLDIRSQKSCTINVTRTGVYSLNLGVTTIQTFIFNMPFGTLNFSPASGATWGQHSMVRPIVNIIAQTVTFNSVHGGTAKFTTFDLTCDVLNINATSSGIVNDTGTGNTANIKVKTINFRGANSRLAGSFVALTLDFNLITHDNTFFLNAANTASLNLEHGSVSSVAPYVNTTNVLYLNSNNTSINYKTGSTISSNLSIQCQNNSGVMVLRGTCNYPNSDRLLNQVNIANTVFIRNANITCKMLFGNRCLETIDIDSSTITVTTTFGSAAQTNSGNTYATPTVRFKGINFIVGPTTDFNMYLPETVFAQNNKPSVSTQQGILYTNGKFDRSKIDIIENPLNQYYDTTQRKMVIVNEKEEIFNKVLDSSKIYMIDAILDFNSTDKIIVPAGGLSISGYGFDISGFKGIQPNSILFENAVGGCGNLFMTNISIEVSGTNSKVFNLTNAGAPTGGADAIELNVVNFQNCTSLGELINFRQGLWDNIGVFGVKDGLTLSGTWSGGFRSGLIIVRNFGTASVTSVLFKKGTDLLFKSRFLTDLNADFKVSGLMSDFTADNFDAINLFQIKGAHLTRNGLINSSENYTGTITSVDLVSDWEGNNGIKNSPIHPFGINTSNMSEYANDVAAAAGE